MPPDEKTAKNAFTIRAIARDYALGVVPGYSAWSAQKRDQGVSEALIAQLDATSILLFPDELQDVDESVFEELLADLKHELGE